MNKIIGNNTNKSFHLDTCKFAPKNATKRVEFASIDEAVKAGYKPCNTCNPNTALAELKEAAGDNFYIPESTIDLPFGDVDYASVEEGFMNPPEVDEAPFGDVGSFDEKVEEIKEVETIIKTEEKPTVKVIGNNANKSFHLDSCKFAPKNAAKRVEFTSIEEALAQGYKPCSTCNPK
jgi:methylphosphotriester-DNA--protein-cysteine methyltransferase